MKFFNNTISISSSDNNYIIVDNNNEEKSCVIVTLQVINPNQNIVQLVFTRGNATSSNSNSINPYQSKIKFKPGTTILDHIMVVQPQKSYLVSCPQKANYSEQIVISCSYGV